MKKYTDAILFALLFVFFTLLVRVIDVGVVGPQDAWIGFATMNVAVHEFFGMNLFWYKLTQAFGIAAIALAGVFAVTGAVELIKRKSLVKVDREVLMLGVVYIIVIVLYVIFEKFAVNYRPVILDPAEGLEPSYPSTHTMLILTIFGTAVRACGFYIKNKKLLAGARLLSLIIMALTIVGRLICGVHWLTDIIGGVLISISLICLYRALTTQNTQKENANEE